VTVAIDAVGLGKRYRRRWALQDCTLSIPSGRVVGLVGANGAGKTTLLHMVVGLLAPSAGNVSVLGGGAGDGPEQLARVGFLAQDAPLYATLTVADHLRLGKALNHHWDDDAAWGRIDDLSLDPDQRAGQLSGGQRAQLALTLAIAKRPELLILDEPVAGLDPLARREFLSLLMTNVAEHELTVVLSSHLISDIERVCDYLIVLAASRVQLAGDVHELLAEHRVLTGHRDNGDTLPSGVDVVDASHTDRQTTLVVRTSAPPFNDNWAVEEIGLEDLVLAYLGRAARDRPPRPARPARRRSRFSRVTRRPPRPGTRPS
jgi:ABC-2 type transport system ATP-binding protein